MQIGLLDGLKVIIADNWLASSWITRAESSWPGGQVSGANHLPPGQQLSAQIVTVS